MQNYSRRTKRTRSCCTPAEIATTGKSTSPVSNGTPHYTVTMLCFFVCYIAQIIFVRYANAIQCGVDWLIDWLIVRGETENFTQWIVFTKGKNFNGAIF